LAASFSSTRTAARWACPVPRVPVSAVVLLSLRAVVGPLVAVVVGLLVAVIVGPLAAVSSPSSSV
jgi:hypothetical protein